MLLAKTHQELKLVSDLKGNKKSVYYYMNSRRICKENLCQLLNGTSKLVTVNTNKVAVFNTFFARGVL